MTGSSPDSPTHRHGDPAHGAWLLRQADRLIEVFRASLCPEGGFYTLGLDNRPLPQGVQELHTTTRLVHCYSVGHLSGLPGCEAMIDQGMAYLWERHRDRVHGGYLWSLDGLAVQEDKKLAYGHVFVLLAGASAKMAGHPDADRLIADVWGVLEGHFWEERYGRFSDEFTRDWQPFSDYRGMNANMHGVEALLAAHDATGESDFLIKAGHILEAFTGKIAPAQDWRLPEHYRSDWTIDPDYAGDPMFRPAGTTPGHSFELARLLLQYGAARGDLDDTLLSRSRNLARRAISDGWDGERGGVIYTLGEGGAPAMRNRFWWPVTEAIGAMSAILKADPSDAEAARWYARLWEFADARLIDHEQGGWFTEIDEAGRPASCQFDGKPDIYHALQACLFPLIEGFSFTPAGLAPVRKMRS